MRLTKRQKTLSIVLGLGLLAVAVDRLFLGSATDTIASAGAAIDLNAGSPLSAAQPGAPVPGQSTQAINAVLANRMQTFAENHAVDLTSLPDAFLPSIDWISPEQQVTAPAMSAEEFSLHHHLTGVMNSAATSYAIIDREIVHLGESLDGFTLISVSEQSAVLESEGERFTITIDHDF